MDEPLPIQENESSGRCPIPDWLARPIAFGLPLLAVIALVWYVFLR
jgi:hypothetical protein